MSANCSRNSGRTFVFARRNCRNKREIDRSRVKYWTSCASTVPHNASVFVTHDVGLTRVFFFLCVYITYTRVFPSVACFSHGYCSRFPRTHWPATGAARNVDNGKFRFRRRSPAEPRVVRRGEWKRPTPRNVRRSYRSGTVEEIVVVPRATSNRERVNRRERKCRADFLP